MAGDNLKPGDTVIYQDRDQIPWGPWAVVGVASDQVTLSIEDRLVYAVNTDLVRKVQLSENPA